MKNFYAFFKQQLTLTHVYGIPVRIDYRWFVVILVLTWLGASSVPDSLVRNILAKAILGFLTIVVFFTCIFLHELSHAFVARREGIDVIDIILHPFGGLARLRREPDTPRAEFRIAAAGPLASFIIAFIFLIAAMLFRTLGENILSPLLFVLFMLNLLLAVFNLFPGYPLDGGRVLRAFLWRRGTDLNKATVLTGKFGQFIAAALAIFGIALILVSKDILTGLWTIVIGIFLYDSASGIIKQIDSFENLTAENIMELPVSIKPDITFLYFVDKILPLQRTTVFPVAENRDLYGFMLLEDAKENLPREKWRETKISDVMRPISIDQFVETETPVTEVKELLRLNGIGILGVLDESGAFVGIIRRGRIRRRN